MEVVDLACAQVCWVWSQGCLDRESSSNTTEERVKGQNEGKVTRGIKRDMRRREQTQGARKGH